MRRLSDVVEFKDVEILGDSTSGEAVSVRIEGEVYWIPYSQVEEISRNPKVQGADRIVMTKWIAQKKELA